MSTSQSQSSGSSGPGRPQKYAALAAALAVTLTIAIVLLVMSPWDDDDSAGPGASGTPTATGSATTPDTPSATSSASATEPTSSPTDGTRATPVYYVSDTPYGPKLFREFHRLPSPAEDRLTPAIQEAVEDTALDPDYYSPWPGGTQVSPVSFPGAGNEGEVVIDLTNSATALHDRPADLSRDQAQMAIEQLIYTAQANAGERAPVSFRLDGGRTDQVLGVPTSEPLAEGDPMEVQGTVWVISPQEGDVVARPVKVTGRGAFFEATVSWQLLQGDTVVKEGFAMSEEGMTLAPYSFVIRGVEPGDYVLRVYDADMSDGEAPGENEDTKAIRVQ